MASLTVGAVRGSGASGQQFATLTLKNKSAKACTLTGYPGVSLRVHETTLGVPATHASGANATITLGPGQSASSQLTVDSTCNAAVSDLMRVYPPNLTTFVDLAINLRGCAMTVTPVAAA